MTSSAGSPSEFVRHQPVDFEYDFRRERQAQVLYKDFSLEMRRSFAYSLLAGSLLPVVSHFRYSHPPRRLAGQFIGSSMLAFCILFAIKERKYAGIERHINVENSKRINQAMHLRHPTNR